MSKCNMRVNPLLGAISICVITLSYTCISNAALFDRGGGLIYDDDLNITWLADANLSASNAFGVVGISANGAMNLNTANSWINAMNSDGGTGYLGLNNWRMPTTQIPDSGCTNLDGSHRTDSRGFTCTGSELGHLFYDELSGTKNQNVVSSGDQDLALFSSIQSGYWSDTVYTPDPSLVLGFNMAIGSQSTGLPQETLFVWAVHDGDIGAVPIPAAAWLFGSGLLGLVGLARRKKA